MRNCAEASPERTERASIGPEPLASVCFIESRRPKGGARLQGPRFADGSWFAFPACSTRAARESSDVERADVLHVAPVRIIDGNGVAHVRDTLAFPRRDSAPVPSLAALLGVDPSAAATPARKGLQIRSRTGVKGNVQDVLHAPNRTRGKGVIGRNVCAIGSIVECATALVHDSRDDRKGRVVTRPDVCARTGTFAAVKVRGMLVERNAAGAITEACAARILAVLRDSPVPLPDKYRETGSLAAGCVSLLPIEPVPGARHVTIRTVMVPFVDKETGEKRMMRREIAEVFAYRDDGPKLSAREFVPALPTQRARPAVIAQVNGREPGMGSTAVRTLRPGERVTLDERAASRDAVVRAARDEERAEYFRAFPGIDSFTASHVAGQAQREKDRADADLKSLRRESADKRAPSEIARAELVAHVARRAQARALFGGEIVIPAARKRSARAAAR